MFLKKELHDSILDPAVESAGTEQHSPTLTRRISVDLAFKISICQLSYRVTETSLPLHSWRLAERTTLHASISGILRATLTALSAPSVMVAILFDLSFSSAGVRNSLSEFCAQLSFNNIDG